MKKEVLSLNREDLYKVVDAVPNNKLKEVEIMLRIMTMPEVVTTEEDLEDIKQAEIDFAKGELKTYTIEELRKEYLND